MLYGERERLRALAEREAQGERFWTSDFDGHIRQKLLYAFSEAGDPVPIQTRARYLILRAEGLPHLLRPHDPPHTDFQNYVLDGPSGMMPTVVEAMSEALTDLVVEYTWGVSAGSVACFYDQVSQLLRDHRISFEFSNGRMIPFESRALHMTVLEPALHLLRDPRFQEADRAYRDALEEVTKGKPGDAITDAATALQEMLVALGCKGDSLGPLLKSALNQGLLATHDAVLTDTLHKTIDWVSADRSNMGDAHKADSAAVQDGWFTVHVVGALIVRLAGPGRSSP